MQMVIEYLLSGNFFPLQSHPTTAPEKRKESIPTVQMSVSVWTIG